MKAIVKWVVLMFWLNGSAVSLAEEMDPKLSEIYTLLISAGDSKKLIDQEHTVELSLKFASEKYLIFHDAYVRLNELERYQIAKWEFSPEVTRGIADKAGVACEVTFMIREVKKTGADKNMPHVVAAVSKVSC